MRNRFIVAVALTLLFSGVAFCHEWTLKNGDKLVDKDWYFVDSKLHLHKPNGEVIKLYTSEIHSSDRGYFIAEYRSRTTPRGPSVNKPATGTGTGSTTTPSAPLPTLFPTSPSPTTPKPTSPSTTSPTSPTSTSLPGPVRSRLGLPLPEMLPSTIGRLNEKLRVNVSYPEAIAFSPDGKYLAIAGKKGVTMVDLATMQYSEANTIAQDSVNAIRYSPDGKRFLTFSILYSRPMTIYGVSDAKLMRLSQSSMPRITSESHLVFHPDGKRIVFQAGFNLCVYDAMTGKQEKTLEKPFNNIIKAIYVNPKGSQAICAHGSHITLMNLATGEQLERMPTTGRGESAISESGRVVYVAQSSYGNEYRGWNTQTGANLPTIKTEKSGSQEFCLSPTGTLLFVPFREIGELWDTRTGTRLAFLNLKTRSHTDFKISPDHRWLAIVSPGNVQIFDLSPLHK